MWKEPIQLNPDGIQNESGSNLDYFISVEGHTDWKHDFKNDIFQCYVHVHIYVQVSPYSLQILMFIHRDLFQPDSKIIQSFITGTCKFIQIYVSSCNNYAGLHV